MKKLLILFTLLCGCAWANAQQPPEQKVTVVYYGSPSCFHCRHMEKEFLEGFLQRHAEHMNFVRVNVQENNVAFMQVLEAYGIERGGTPFMAIGKSCLMGYPNQIAVDADDMVARAIRLREETLSVPQTVPAAPKQAAAEPNHVPDMKTEKPASAQENMPETKQETAALTHESVFQKLTFWMIAGAGLIDGINPCAFAVIVFFVSFLSVYKYTRREMLVVGAAYCAAVFAAYVLLGLGAFKFLYAMKGFYYVMWTVKAATVLLCAVFLALSVYDYWHYYRTKDASGLILQLPTKYKTFIHKVMHMLLKDRQKSVWRLGFAAVAVGFIVSLVEAVCTGQVYLPTIVVVLKEAGEHFWLAAGYLLFYNLMFILPLVGVFALALAGYESKTFGGWLKRHLGLTKLLMCAVFLALLAVLIRTW